VQLAPSAVGTNHVAANAITGDKVLDGSLSVADLGDAPRMWAEPLDYGGSTLSTVASVERQITVVSPAAGQVLVIASGTFYFSNTLTIDGAGCSISTDTSFQAPEVGNVSEWTANGIKTASFAGARLFTTAAGSRTFRLVCSTNGSSNGVQLFVPALSAVYIPGS
jgi:hypothetical protein